MESKLVFVFACLAFVGFASALDCYSCSKEECEKEKTTWAKIQDCGKTLSPNHVAACAKMVYKDKTTNKDYTVRKCVQATKKADGTLSYSCTPNNDASLVTCESCDSDWCNSAPSVNFSLFALFGVVLAYLVPTYLVQ